MGRVVRDIKDLLLGNEQDVSEADVNDLWDEAVGTVPGGINWTAEVAERWDDDSVVGVTGPELDESSSRW